MKKVTLKNYAVKHKMSLFSVVKLLKSGKLKSETTRENGKERVYILIENQETETQTITDIENQQPEEKRLDMRVAELEREVERLRNILEKLQEREN
jgi:predicted RNase H-like nuclease (RuvC/YqgF family)